MFKAKHVVTGRIVDVYAVSRDQGRNANGQEYDDTSFLIRGRSDKFEWVDIGMYEVTNQDE